jgi:hypothetical protein
MKQALIHGSRICEFNTPFPVHADLKWVEVADDTTVEDTYVDGAVVKFVKPSETPMEAIARLEAEVTPRRLREGLNDPSWVNDIEAKIELERAKL